MNSYPNTRLRSLSKGVSRAALGAALGLFITGAALAQSSTGALRVTIQSSGGAPVAGATVVVSSPSSLVTKTATTDADGSVRISGLDPATNYTVKVVSPGYTDFSASNVAVVTGQDRSVGYALASDGTTVDAVVITGTSLAAVDVTSAAVSTTLNLDVTESLPTGRDYQSYLQLIPGVKPSPENSKNPSSRSGVNYADVLGATGESSDNAYYLDGVDVTDPTNGLAGGDFNSEIIQEQQVIVGGVPAEYAGGSGLVSRVVSKSGGNEWHGSINYYLQNDGLVAEDKHITSGGFSTYDTAFTLGGPVIKDKIWVFGSYQKKYREDEVLDPTTGVIRRTVDREKELGFFKATWQITDNDRLTGTFFNDPEKRSGSNVATTLNNRDEARVLGGDNYKVDYSHDFGDLQVNVYGFKHQGELTRLAADQRVRDTIGFRTTANSTIEQRNLGGSGVNLETHRDRQEYGGNFEYFIDTDWGSHTFKGGFTSTENTYAENGSVPGGVNYTSLSSIYSGVTYGDYTTGSGGSWTARAITANDNPRILPVVQANATARAAVDTNGDGTVTTAELNAYRFTNTTGNPYGNLNIYRSLRTQSGAYEVRSEGKSLYLQDTWTLNQLTINAGVRAEKWEHFDSTGAKTATFDWDLAPRVSVVYDVFGDARSKVFGFVGRYYDPARNNMSDFAGALTGPVDEEQVNIAGQWLTFRTRGGATTPDAVFAPTTKTPYTDEIMFGASTTIGRSIGVSATVTQRKTRDILEDYDLALYSDPTATAADGAHGVAYPGSAFYLPLSYFGYTTTPNSNYVLATLAGGKRDYTGFELVVTKYKTSNWFGQASYTYNDAKGNTNSDSNADYQGDWVALDPRAPNAYGEQPGNIKHLFKAYGSYDFDFGLQVSGVYNWNSGAIYTPAQIVANRYFAPMSDPGYTHGGVFDSWYLPGGIGSQTGPSYSTFDMRFKYVYELPGNFGQTEVFLDVFNVFNKQSPTAEMKLIAGDGIYKFQQSNAWVQPLRAYLGVRYSF